MGRAAFALCVASLLLAGMADRPQTSRLVSVAVGEDVFLDCLCEDSNVVMLFWFKQNLGQSPHMLSKFYKHDKNGVFSDEYQNNIRFHLDTTQNRNRLTIRNVQLSDSATYHCITGYLYIYEFRESFTVSVRGAGSKIPAVVRQWPSGVVRPKPGMTLACTVHAGTCDEEHRVYWFKNSENSQPGIIYTDGDRRDQCERTRHDTHTCYYNLTMEALDAFHNGTFYCALVSCGRIVFGEGSKMDSDDKDDSPPVLLYALSVALALTTILVVWLASAVLRAKGCQCSDSAAATNVEDLEDENDLHYAALMVPGLRRAEGPGPEDPISECVYTSVKHSR